MILGKKKKIRIAVIVLAVVVVIGIAIGLIAVAMQNAKDKEAWGKEVMGLAIEMLPNRVEYYVGESFDPTGIRVQVITNAQSETYFINDISKLTFSGFDSSVVNEAVPVTVSYNGFTTTFNVSVVEYKNETPKLVSVEVCNLKTEYTLYSWTEYGITTYGATIKCTYSDGSIKEIPLEYSNIDDTSSIDSVGEHTVTIKYKDGGITKETKVIITITQ